VDWDARSKTVEVNPHLPEEWEGAKLHNLRIGSLSLDLDMQREGGALRVRAVTKQPEKICMVTVWLSDNKCAADLSAVHTVLLPLPAVEVGISAHLPEPGERTRQLKVLSEEMQHENATFVFEGQAGSAYDLPVRMNKTGVSVDGGSVANGKLHLEFAAGQGYSEKTVTFKW